jgi:branched-chain amino acid transport system substrate-binding protein
MRFRISHLLARVLSVTLCSSAMLFATGAAAKDVVKLAFIGPLTGGNSANGLGGRNATDLAVKQRNAEPRAKYQYELVVLDDECKPNIGVQVATKAASDKDIIAGVTHYCSTVAMATVDTYHKFGLPVVVWGAVLPDITYANDYKEIHRVNGTMINQNETAAKFMTGLKYKRWAVIHDTTDYGKGHNKYFSEYLGKNGGQIVGTFGVTADQQDFSAELTKIKDLKPEVIYFGGTTPLGVRIRTQMDKLGVKAVFQGTSGIVSDAFIEGLGPLAEGALAFREGAPMEKLPGGKAFLEQYAAQKYNDPPEAYGAFAYAAANLIMDAIDKVGPDRRKVRNELNKTRDYQSVVGAITFDDHRQNSVPLITKLVVQDGKWIVWEDSDYAKGKRKLVKP